MFKMENSGVEGFGVVLELAILDTAFYDIRIIKFVFRGECYH